MKHNTANCRFLLLDACGVVSFRNVAIVQRIRLYFNVPFQTIEIASMKVTKKVKSMQVFRKPVNKAVQVTVDTTKWQSFIIIFETADQDWQPWRAP